MTMAYSVRPDVLSRELDGELVLLDTRSATYFSLNRTGTRAWQLLNAHTTVGDICETLAREYTIAQPQLMADLTPFIDDLLETGLIQREP